MDFGKLFSFTGRHSRQSFWFSILVVMGLGIIGAILYVINEWLGILGYIPLMWISLAASVKRWHDRGKSGWWVLIGAIPIIGGIWALVETGFLVGDPGDNQYGSPESGSPFTS